ncbi:hypothetical protein NI389_18695 (plasmid) [Pseudoalteromonas xiamenensis]|uniref:hypothetical protein n=1 Tax=Pseudoalteromonas xiamenensis TaxID=882626 RepID=UPI0027E53CEF|nr:hypothetical protein [Pseudoalteromonas xiamenensis]WMN61836.1 hypothetical protein NI389_18695 [Pseudoalteromonas xiamenensis]
MNKRILFLLGSLTMTSNTVFASIDCELHVPKEGVVEKPFIVEFTVKNNAATEAEILTWLTPLEGFWSSLFILRNQQKQELVYQGPKAKRLAPTPDDYLHLKPNESYRTSLDLAEVYEIPPGKYTLIPNSAQSSLPCWQSLHTVQWSFMVSK